MSRSLEQIDLSIEGMTCSSCVATVERALNKVEGAQAAVNLATESAHILVPPGTKPNELIEAVKKSGYTAKLRADETESFSYSNNLGKRSLASVLLTFPIILFSMWHSVHFRIDEFIIDQLNRFNLPLPLYSPTGWLLIALSAPVVLLIAWPIHRAALRNFLHPTMDNLISLGSLAAFSWSIYANSTGSGEIFAEVAASVVTFITFGRYLESRAKRRAGSALAALLSLNPKEVRILRGSEEVTASIKNLAVGDRCVIRPGERIPTDGVVIDGVSSVDTSFITGESLPIEVFPGSEVIAGALNIQGRLVVESRRVGSDTELSRITKMVLTAQTEKAPIQRRADQISSIFVPIVLLISTLTLGIWLWLGNSVESSISAAVAVMVIACPCALGLATPVALLVATGKGASQGIVLRKTSVLERAPSITTVVFDKTGTLTTGVMKVQNIIAPDLGGQALPISAPEILKAVHALEKESNHPIAQAIVRELSTQGIGRLTFSEFSEVPGQGLAARVNFGEKQLPVLIGTSESIRRATVSFHHHIESGLAQARLNGNSVAVVAIDGIACALFEVGDSIKSDAKDAIQMLRDEGIESWLLTGDQENAAHHIAELAGISSKNVISLATPERKLSKIKELRANGAKVLFIGDGVNDAAAMAESDLSMAMGTGTDTAIATADITLMKASLKSALAALALSKKTLRIIRGNLFWALIYNVILIPIAAAGLLNPMLASAAMAASSLLVVFNSLRLSRDTNLPA